MLTPDTMIDRRIFIEAETLIDEGYEVILLAEAGSGLETFEIQGNVPVERVSHGRHDLRLRRLYWILERIDSVKARSGSLHSPLWGMLRGMLATGVKIAGKIHQTISPLSSYEADFLRRALLYRPDIVHVHDLPLLRAGVALKKTLGIPLVYDMHEFYPEQACLAPQAQKELRHREASHIHRADRHITVNFMLGDAIRKKYSLPSIAIVQNAVPPGLFDPRGRHDRLREEYPSLKGKKILLYQGWIAEGRNLESLVQGLARTCNDRWSLAIMGYGEYAAELEKMAGSLGIAHRVQIVPPKSQQELLSYTASADAGIIPYRYTDDINTRYASPNKLYEFITARLPILANRLEFVEHVVRGNGFGMVADLNSPEAVALLMDSLDDRTLRGFRRALEEKGELFSWENEKRILRDLYQELMSTSG